jgi:hypothetical protein
VLAMALCQSKNMSLANRHREQAHSYGLVVIQPRFYPPNSADSRAATCMITGTSSAIFSSGM